PAAVIAGLGGLQPGRVARTIRVRAERHSAPLAGEERRVPLPVTAHLLVVEHAAVVDPAGLHVGEGGPVVLAPPGHRHRGGRTGIPCNRGRLVAEGGEERGHLGAHACLTHPATASARASPQKEPGCFRTHWTSSGGHWFVGCVISRSKSACWAGVRLS